MLKIAEKENNFFLLEKRLDYANELVLLDRVKISTQNMHF